MTTGEYSRSKTQGERIIGEDSSEFSTALRVCAVAESLKLPTLRNLATDMAVEDSCWIFSSITALYITRRVKQFCEELTEESATLFLLGVATPKTVCELLFKTVIELKIQQLSSTAISRDRELRAEEVTAAGLHGQVGEWPEQIDHCTEHPISAASNHFAVFTPADPSRFPPVTPPRSPEFHQNVLTNPSKRLDWTDFFVSNSPP